MTSRRGIVGSVASRSATLQRLSVAFLKPALTPLYCFPQAGNGVPGASAALATIL